MTARDSASTIAEREVGRVTSFSDLLCDIEEFRNDYKNLFEQICRQRQSQLDEAPESVHPEILQEFAAEAGFLIGLEIGR